MDYLGDKLTVAHGHVAQWMGSVRRSLQEALNLVGTAVSEADRNGASGGGGHPGRAPLKRTSSFRHFASRSRESFRRFSVRSQQRFQSLRKRSSTLSTTSDPQDTDRLKQCCIGPSAKAKDTDDLVQESGQFCNCEERDQYGTYEERSSSTNEEVDPCDTRHERKYSKHENYRPVSPCKEPSTILAACPRKEHVQSRVSMSSRSELTPTSEHHLGFFQDSRSINYGLSSFELESPDDTDSLQSTDPGTQVGPTPHGFSFLEPVTTLDSGAQKSRIQLRRKTIRRAPTIHKKGSGDQTESIGHFFPMGEDSWMYKDSTGKLVLD
ncbi:hypothetical protein scyTo_0014959 [Scyliorhinus torazame]|uniref:Tankyrase 1-binding protein C-terminal domain-containing protein n=1 Tax=Scyliorhinus torazame TaxID=75743 RepID=A0A401NZ50_SCYTO|nr:hypothetical protein [Scyliorhinus torazame]